MEETGKKNGGKNGKKQENKEKTDENSGHYVIASSQPPEHRLLEHRTLLLISSFMFSSYGCVFRQFSIRK